MQINYCEFPDDLYYDTQNDTWLRLDPPIGVIGITSILSALAGRIRRISFKINEDFVKRGQLIATLESEKFFGAIRSPLDCKILKVNSRVEQEPRLVNDRPYSEGWIAEIRTNTQGPNSLLSAKEAVERLEARIVGLHIRCFKKIPDQELVAVGTECSATLVNLGELLKPMSIGGVVHVVSDDPVSGIELERWAELTKNEIIESRDEENLHHYLIEKKS